MSESEPNVQVSNTLSDEAEAQTALPMAGDVLSGHRIIEKLTSGGFGTVFLADNLGLPGQHTVVKCMPLGQLSEREANMLRHIDHPMVVKVLALGRAEKFQYIVMEYLRGETLDALLGKHHQLGPIQAVRIGLRIADALDAVHEKGLVHRDLKPANIMLKLAKDHGKFVDWLKLIDFGLARDLGHELTIAEGTPEYVAPETLQQQPVTPSSDLYALGVILHEMLTGQRPYQASSVHAMVSQHVNAEVPHVRDLAPDVGVELDQLVFELMSKEPSNRPHSASEVAKRLSRLERELSDGSTGLNVAPPLLLRTRDASTVVVPMPLTETAMGHARSPSTMRETAGPTPLMLPVKRRAKRAPRWPWAVAAVLLLLGVWALFGISEYRARKLAPVGQPQAVAPVIVAAPPAPVVTPSPAVVVEPAPGAAIAPPRLLPHAKVISKKTIAPKPKEQYTVTATDCEPSEAWKSTMKRNLSELGDMAKGDKVRYPKRVQAISAIDDLRKAATSRGECATVERLFNSLHIEMSKQ